MFKNTFDSIDPNLHVLCVFVCIFHSFSSSNNNNFSRAITQAAPGAYSCCHPPQRTQANQARGTLCGLRQAHTHTHSYACVCVYLVFPHCCFQEAPAYTQNKGQHDRLVSIVEFVPDHGLCIWIDMTHTHTHTNTRIRTNTGPAGPIAQDNCGYTYKTGAGRRGIQ